MISGIGGITFVPQPTVSLSPEFFYFGDDIIGGFLKAQVKGTYYAQDISGFQTFYSDCLELIDTCATITLNNECTPNSVIDKIDGSVGLVKDVQLSPAGDPLNINYTINLECSKDSTKSPIITNQSKVDFGADLGTDMIVKSYSESVNVDYSNTSTFYVNNTTLVKSNGKFNIALSIAAYENDQCDSNSLEYASGLSLFLRSRADSIVNDPSIVNINIPSSTVTKSASNFKKTLKKTSANISFDLNLLPVKDSSMRALVDLSETRSTDNVTASDTVTIKGSIVGLDDNISISGGASYSGFANAEYAYDKIREYYTSGLNHDTLITACSGDSATGVALTGHIGDTCYQLTNTKLSEFPAQNKIDFEMVYKDAELCELYGYKINVEYEERPAVSGRAEHFAPGRPATYKPLVYYSNATTAPKYKLTIKGELPKSCLQQSVGNSHGDFVAGSGLKDMPKFAGKSKNMDDPIDLMKSAVSGELTDQKNKWSLNPTDNVMLVSKIENEGRYSFSITEEYIKCQ